MPDILRSPIDEAPQVLGGPAPQLDPISEGIVQTRIADAERFGYERGVADGRAAEQSRLGQLVHQLDDAIRALHDEIRDQRTAAARASLELVESALTAILDAAPPPAANDLLTRILTAVEAIDDAPLTVHLSAANAATLADDLAARGLECTADPTLADHDARISGPHAGVELTREAMLQAALAELREQTA